MEHYGQFELATWIGSNSDGVSVSLAGSAGQPLSLEDLSSISTNPEATAKALEFNDFKLGSGSEEGEKELRQRVAGLYEQSKAKVTADDVVIANGTTGANLLVLQALIGPGDHVVSTYPMYGPLIEIPKGVGANLDYWRLDPDNEWQGSLDELEKLLSKETKVLILNNPHNPTGSVLSTEVQAKIIELAAAYNVTIFTDEIFRPLFHTDRPPTSLLEHSSTYDKIIVTGSLSKAYGLSGVRIGWAVTKSKQLRAACLKMRLWTLMSVSILDEIIAKEVLGERCKEAILKTNLAIARENLSVLKSFLAKHKKTVSCVLPTGAATAFVRFDGAKSGRPVDDLDFCRRLKQETGVLLSPASLCFGAARDGDFRGYVRMHITVPVQRFSEGLEKIAGFLESASYSELDE